METIDVLRGLTILWITAFHFYVDTRGGAGDITARTIADAVRSGQTGWAFEVVGRALVAMPAYRLDLLLFVTGLVLSLARPVPFLSFLRRRARALLPNYWLGSLAAFALLIGLALLRAWIRHTDAGGEILHGTLLARATYLFHPSDVFLSFSILGRLSSPAAMQVMAPSLWYILLVMQVQLAFPALRWCQQRVGSAVFLLACTAIMLGARSAVLHGTSVPGFGPAATLVYFLPFRLFAPALGMVVARWAPLVDEKTRLARWPLALLLPAVIVLIASMVYGAPLLRAHATGAMLPLLAGLPALWTISASLRRVPAMAAGLIWVGEHSLSLLVVQDLLRLTTGTCIALAGRLDAITWYAMPVYLAVAIVLTPFWHRFTERVAVRITRRA